MPTLQQSLPIVHIHCCAACQRPHHWLSHECQDTHCPWIHHLGSYGNILATLGECNCAFLAVDARLAEIIPASQAIRNILVRMPGMALATVEGKPYEPTAEEWLAIIGAIVDEQRGGFRNEQVWQEFLADLRLADLRLAHKALC